MQALHLAVSAPVSGPGALEGGEAPGPLPCRTCSTAGLAPSPPTPNPHSPPLTSMPKSPRMVPGALASGLVAPIMVRPVLTTSLPSNTMATWSGGRAGGRAGAQLRQVPLGWLAPAHRFEGRGREAVLSHPVGSDGGGWGGERSSAEPRQLATHHCAGAEEIDQLGEEGLQGRRVAAASRVPCRCAWRRGKALQRVPGCAGQHVACTSSMQQHQAGPLALTLPLCSS